MDANGNLDNGTLARFASYGFNIGDGKTHYA
jgi:hypothetical protein